MEAIRQKFGLFMTATDLDGKGDENKIAVFLNLLWDDGLELFNSFTFTDVESQSLTGTEQKFDDYCSSKKLHNLWTVYI